MPKSLPLLVGAALVGSLATGVIAASAAADEATDRAAVEAAGALQVEELDLGGTALARAVRLRNLVPIVFPMDPEPGCAILDNFGDSRSGGRRHEGVDIMATFGQDVYAVADGTLTRQVIDGEAGSSLSGNYWTLTAADGTEYVFMHLSAFAAGLAVGDDVVVGQVIGYVGDTGNPGAGNYHLHFEHHPRGGAAVNPMTLLAPLIPPACVVA